jgi:hypothetical protein
MGGMSLGTGPSDEESRNSDKRGESKKSEVDPVIRDFESALLSNNTIDLDALSKLSVAHLPKVLDLAISDEKTIRTFRKSIKSLCEDPDSSTEAFRENICGSLASAIQEDCLKNPISAFYPLKGILDVTKTVLASIDLNPSHSAPPSLTKLLTALIDLIDTLGNYRTGSQFAWNADDLVNRFGQEELIDIWDILHTAAFNHLISGLRIESYTPSQAFLDNCGNLLRSSMTPVAYNMGPLQSTTEVEAHGWVKLLHFAATLGAVGASHVVEENNGALEKIARDLKGWRRGDEFEKIQDPFELKQISYRLGSCELSALRALASCKSSESTRELWRATLVESEATSTSHRLALFALAKEDPAAATEGVVEILSIIGSGEGTRYERNHHLNTIVRFLGFQGAHTVLESAFAVDKRPFIPAEYQERVIEILKRRYERHRSAAAHAAEKLRSCESEKGEPEGIVRATLAKEGFIWNRRARAVLKTFAETF